MLGNRPYGEEDKIIDLFSKELGRIEARVVSASKIKSKLSPHLDVLNLITIRLVNKNRFTITDVLLKRRFKKTRRDIRKLGNALLMVQILKEILPPSLPDLELWYFLNRSLSQSFFDYKMLLKILGYDPSLAFCFFCGKKKVKYFFLKDQIFICPVCKVNIPEKDLIPISS